MPPKIEMWTKEKEHILIFEVEKRPILWDVSCGAYKRTDLKYGQWHEIAEILGPSFTADMVLHRFISMKQTFMTNYRKERESKGRCSGKSPEEIYKPKWILYEKLKFLRKTCAQADSLSNLQSPLNISNSNSNESSRNDIAMENIEFLENDFTDIQQWQAMPIDNQENETDNSPSFTSTNSPASSSSLCYKSNPNSPSDPSTALPELTHPSALKPYNRQDMYVKRGAAKKRRVSVIEEAMDAIKTLTNQPLPISDNDSAEHFGNFVTARLREMSPISRKNCEHEIMKSLANY